MTVSGSTINGNTTGTAGAGGGVAGSGGGGIYNDDVLIASNSTISGNTTGGLGGNGGGVNNHQLMWVTNCTVAFNNAITNTGNGIYHDAAGAGASNIRNTIVNHNGPSGRGPDTGGPFASQGHNLVGNADGSTGFTADGDQAGDSIGPGLTPLGPLANNGGPTQTHALLPGSTAIDAGDNCVTEPAHCGDANIPTLTTDQRGAGINRLVNGTVDIGAFESRGFTIVATNGTPQQATIGTAFGAPLVATVSSAFGEPFAGGVVAFVAPLNGLVPGATFVAGIPIAYVAVNATGVITSPAVNANTQAGSYDVLAYTANNSTTASFALTNLKGASSTAVSSSLNPVGFGQNVTFTGNVTSHVMAPTGVVQFKSNGNNIGTAQPLNGSGVATLTTSTLTAGTHTISADYSGDADYFASTGTLPATQVVTPSLAINDVSVTEGNSGTVSASFTVTLSGPSNQTVEVNFATANGTAQSGSDYSSNNGLLSFAPTQTSKPISITVNGDTAFEANETFFVNLSAATGATIADAQGIGTILNDDPQGGTIVFSSSAFSVAETAGSVLITVNRNGDATQAVTVDYATADLTADGRKDYTPASGTLQFDVGVVARTFPVLVNVDAFIEGSELVQLSLSSPTNAAVLGVPATATLQIDNSAWTPPPASSIDDAASFVRQHYHDFLNREPDAPGLAFWTNQITECQQPGATCSAEVRRINVSAAFFLSIEFQETGYLVYRMYKAGYDNIAGTPVPLRLNEFLPDTQQIGKGVQVGVGDWQAQLENNKAAFALAFVSRARFTTAYPTTLTPAQFVDALFANTGVTPSTADRNAAIGEFSGAGNTGDTPARARALRRVAENATMKQQETNRAFVLMQYFGYLRRNPNDAPEQNQNFDGYNFWLGKLNQFNGNFVEAEMVKAFIVSGEYRQRFGP
jgi:hypothetical protein